eukprot:TRINITY_DN7545_c0_g1_i1.p3 TRINITY_DN7545_c0_g1~~TRINITY_DN7545_c0_g1_i1.p3  ORF type:complete len:126 (+),score=4.18 TRINITY_DN7545_c0_g1_i1:98-475(+)
MLRRKRFQIAIFALAMLASGTVLIVTVSNTSHQQSAANRLHELHIRTDRSNRSARIDRGHPQKQSDAISPAPKQPKKPLSHTNHRRTFFNPHTSLRLQLLEHLKKIKVFVAHDYGDAGFTSPNWR